MDIFALIRALVNLDSTTGREQEVGNFLAAELSSMATHWNGRVERMQAAPGRENVFASFGEPVVTLSTHMDTVPPYFAAAEDEEFIYGRGACDAKGIIASMMAAAKTLLEEGARNFGMLFVVGEERDSAGALAAARNPRGSKFLINGEPTENMLALGSKGALRYELVARGRLAHSAYPELGHSAIHALLDTLAEIRAMEMPRDGVLGDTTLNVGTLRGGRAPNVVADEAAAEIMFRLVGDPAGIRSHVARAAAAHGVEAREVLLSRAMRFKPLDGFPTSVVAFTTDIPSFDGTWGEPFLIGPGSIHVAHTAEERVAKKELVAAAGIYARMVRRLLTNGSAP
jgi:acetylornithine deacetylase